MTEQEQIILDIDSWSDKRLKQWFVDSVDRYKMADLTEDEGIKRTTATLMTILAFVLLKAGATPEEVGYRMMEAVKFLQDYRKARREKP